MLCVRCVKRSSVSSHTQMGRAAQFGLLGGRTSNDSCVRCGGPFVAVDPIDAVVGKLVQLARFGLGDGSGPLLISSRKEG